MKKTMYAVFSTNPAVLSTDKNATIATSVELFSYDESLNTAVRDADGDLVSDSQYPAISSVDPSFIVVTYTPFEHVAHAVADMTKDNLNLSRSIIL